MPRGTKLRPDERESILQLRGQGHKILDISRALNRSRRVIERFLKNPNQYGAIKRTGRKKILTDGDETDIINKANNNALSYSKLAQTYTKNVSKSTVWRILQKAKHISNTKKRKLPGDFFSDAKPTQYERERMLYRNKPRKILNLEERVQAIRLYDKNPVYQRVASVFHCSWEQIKNIVSNRDSILAYYARCQMVSETDGPRQVRSKKINFLGNAVYEYVKRAVYHNGEILTDDLLIQKATEFRDYLEVEKFFPSQNWINDFKQVYNIDYENSDNFAMSEPPPKSLTVPDIVAHCTQEVENALKSISSDNKAVKGPLDQCYELTDYDDAGVSQDGREYVFHSIVSIDNTQNDLESIDNTNEHHRVADMDENSGDHVQIIEQPVEVQEIVDSDDDLDDDDDDDDEDDDMDYELITDRQRQTPNGHLEDSNEPGSSEPTIYTEAVEIKNYRQALAALAPLEKFAIDREDFRAINLISLLSSFYENCSKKESALRRT